MVSNSKYLFLSKTPKIDMETLPCGSVSIFQKDQGKKRQVKFLPILISPGTFGTCRLSKNLTSTELIGIEISCLKVFCGPQNASRWEP